LSIGAAQLKTAYTIFIWTLAFLLFLSLITYDPMDVSYNTTRPNYPTSNSVGIIGALTAFGCFFAFGFSAYLFVFILFFLGGVMLRQEGGKGISMGVVRVVAAVFMILSMCCLLQMPVNSRAMEAARRMNIVGAGGVVGEILDVRFMLPYMGYAGSLIICGAVAIASVLVFTRFNAFYYIGVLLKKLFCAVDRSVRLTAEVIKHKRRTVPLNVNKVRVQQFARPSRGRRKVKVAVALPKEEQEELLKVGTREDKTPRRDEEKTAEPPRPPKARTPRTVSGYKLPDVALLNEGVSQKELRITENIEKNVGLLRATLREFGIDAEVGNVIRGPVITRYEVHPSPGVKIQKITTLADDIALAMAAGSIRIVAPIPGKSAVGIEVPNSKATLVGLKELLLSKEYKRLKRWIPLAIGREISGAPVIADLTEMPHLLIAGATGSGKTVCINSMILSILFSCTPDEIKLILIDPKRVEMTNFRNIPHLITPVVTEPKLVSQVLYWALREMESRYELFSTHLVRNIVSFNTKIKQNGAKVTGEDGKPVTRLPYMVVIIDELADLMLVARKDVEDPVIRLAQMGRAAGIHIILATQRPSVNVITGLIKANFPTRIAFKVATRVDSKVILDTMGADRLLGRGDMIFIPPGSSRRLRIQGTLVGDDEINAAVDFVKQEGSPDYREDILTAGPKEELTYDDMDDNLYDDAVKVVRQLGQASASMLQRRMRIGYTRAARLVDMMEERGIVGPAQGSKPREIIG
jgi:S-DNA-T family DNA segregation ATPase FtsK/SpoIIIE